MAKTLQIIQTSNKDDIVTGFDISCEPMNILDSVLDNIPENLKDQWDEEYGDEWMHWFDNVFDNIGNTFVKLYTDAINTSAEIFTKHASVSIWSSNMLDNAVCGISGTMPNYDPSTNIFYFDVRVGVNTNEIGNPGNWDVSPNPKFKYGGRYHEYIYSYNGKRMKPDVDYSIGLESGAAHRRNPAISPKWKGFVERAEKEAGRLF